MRQFRRRNGRLKIRDKRRQHFQDVSIYKMAVKEVTGRLESVLRSYGGEFGRAGGRCLEAAGNTILNALFNPGTKIAIVSRIGDTRGKLVGLIVWLSTKVGVPVPVVKAQKLTWPNGSVAEFVSADGEVRGPEHSETWKDEVA